MKILNSIILWGILDILLFIKIVITAVLSLDIPFYNEFIEVIEVALAFEEVSILLFTILTQLVVFSFIFSGVFMLLRKKVGVYLSIAQFPFRLFLVVPPTLFFLPSLGEFFSLPVIFIVIFSGCIEIIKLTIQVLYLKNERTLKLEE